MTLTLTNRCSSASVSSPPIPSCDMNHALALAGATLPLVSLPAQDQVAPGYTIPVVDIYPVSYLRLLALVLVIVLFFAVAADPERGAPDWLRRLAVRDALGTHS